MHTGLNATAAGQHRTRPWVRAMERTALMAMATERNETSISTNTTAATLAIATWKRSNTCAIMSVSAGEPIEREEGGWVGEAGGEDVLCVCVCVSVCVCVCVSVCLSVCLSVCSITFVHWHTNPKDTQDTAPPPLPLRNEKPLDQGAQQHKQALG